MCFVEVRCGLKCWCVGVGWPARSCKTPNNDMTKTSHLKKRLVIPSPMAQAPTVRAHATRPLMRRAARGRKGLFTCKSVCVKWWCGGG